MKDEELQALFAQLMAGWENEVVEFKQAGNDFDTDKIGRYFSALSNEANLRSREHGWIVFGVENRNRTVVGSSYRTEAERLNGLKQQIASDTKPGVTFRDIHALETPQGRVILFEIPAAPLGIPIAWKGHYYARAGESLTSLGLDKLDDIRVLIQNTDLNFEDVLSLDRVQKRLPLDDETVLHLKRAKLIEGRKPNFHVSAAVASAAETKAAYIKTRALDDGYYRKLVTEYLEKFGHASRTDIDGLLRDKLSDALDEKQKATKIGNLLTSMRKAGMIQNVGGRGLPRWTLVQVEQKNEKE